MNLKDRIYENKPGISFFVPCLNEIDNISGAIDTIIQAMKSFSFPYELLIYDDDSTDGTPDLVRNIMREEPKKPIHLVQNEKRAGMGANYLAGAKIARYQYYMQINGDNDIGEDTMQQIIRHLGEADMIIPYLAENDVRTFKRRALSRIFVKIVNLINGTRLPYYNGLTLHETKNIRDWPYASVDGFGFLAELLCVLLRRGKSYKLIQICHRGRQGGVSKAISASNFISVSKSLFRILFRRIQSKIYHNCSYPNYVDEKLT